MTYPLHFRLMREDKPFLLGVAPCDHGVVMPEARSMMVATRRQKWALLIAGQSHDAESETGQKYLRGERRRMTHVWEPRGWTLRVTDGLDETDYRFGPMPEAEAIRVADGYLTVMEGKRLKLQPI